MRVLKKLIVRRTQKFGNAITDNITCVVSVLSSANLSEISVSWRV